MTVTYTAKVATAGYACFLRLLFRWRGSVYKLIWREFVFFVMSYYLLNLIYRFALHPEQQRIFENISEYCEKHGNLIPLSFVLGFYVALVIKRWWEQFLIYPRIDRSAMYISASVTGNDERGRLMRRTIMRYLCLGSVITLSSISPPVKKRFPSFTHMTEAGLMLPSEQKVLEDIQTPHNKYFVPLVWAMSLCMRARKEGRIKDDFAVKTIIDEINAFRGQCGGLFAYDKISIPLVYTQVVTLAVYTFFVSCLMGRQLLARPNVQETDIYVPIFTFLQFFFYMGWLKVAEQLVNPFGEDDDDFDMNAVVDKSLQISYLVVDEMHQEHPELIKDQYWDEVEFELPYTAATAEYKPSEPFLGSAMDIKLDENESEFVLPTVMEEDEGQREEEDKLLGSPHEDEIAVQVIPTSQSKESIARSIESSKSPKNKMAKFFRQISRKSSTKSISKAPSKKKLTRIASAASSVSLPMSRSVSVRDEEVFVMDDLIDKEMAGGTTPSESHLATSVTSRDFLQRLRSRAASHHYHEPEKDLFVRPKPSVGKKT